MLKLEANRKVAFQLAADQLQQAKLEAMWMQLPEFAVKHGIEVESW